MVENILSFVLFNQNISCKATRQKASKRTKIFPVVNICYALCFIMFIVLQLEITKKRLCVLLLTSTAKNQIWCTKIYYFQQSSNEVRGLTNQFLDSQSRFNPLKVTQSRWKNQKIFDKVIKLHYLCQILNIYPISKHCTYLC